VCYFIFEVGKWKELIQENRNMPSEWLPGARRAELRRVTLRIITTRSSYI
jgi:hypothetical protein